MLVYAAIDFVTALPLVIGIVGLGGLVFTALRFRRDDTSAIVGQQDTIFAEMRSLNAELRETTDRLRVERDELTVQVQQLTAQVQELRHDPG
jgi:hypothetical protein